MTAANASPRLSDVRRDRTREDLEPTSQSGELCVIVDPVEEFALPTWPSLVPGRKLDRYELICPIGEGGMGQVWVARQTGKFGFERLVAVKTILPRFALEERCQAMFVDEVRVASRVEHANVAKILDVGEQENTTYLVMEYVDGEALSVVRDILRKKGVPIPTGILLHIMRGVCAGVQAAHELCDREGQPLGVVHRDISPQNILVSTSGEAKLIDFGLAKARDRISANTSEGTLKGKIRYMAPEQAFGRTVDCRTDIWSIGAVLHDALSGRPLYDGENETQILHRMMCSGPILSLPPSVHPAVAGVVRRALATAPEDRFSTSAEMQQAIEDAMIDAKVTATSQTVAAFFLEHAGPRLLARKDVIRRGLQLAALQADAIQRLDDDRSRATEIVELPQIEENAPLDPDALDRWTMSALSSEMPSPRDSDLGFRRATGRAVGLAAVLLGVALVAAGLAFVSERFLRSGALAAALAGPMAEYRATPRSLFDRTAGQRVSPYVIPGTRAKATLLGDTAAESTEAERTPPSPPPPKGVRGGPTSRTRRYAPKAIIDDGF